MLEFIGQQAGVLLVENTLVKGQEQAYVWLPATTLI